MELRQLTAQELKQLHKRVLHKAFPPNELKPYSVMATHLREHSYDTLALCDGGQDVSWALFWHSPKCVLLDYLVTAEDRRGQGLGAELLRRTAQHYLPQRPILVEVEAPTAQDAQERKLQQRRLNFYLRLGFVETGIEVLLYGVHYRILILGEGTGLKEAYLELYRSGTSPSFMKRFLKVLKEEP